MSEKTIVLDFDVIREPWNMYELRDGSILKTKHILTGVRKYEKEGGRRKGYDIRGQTINITHYVPEDMKGPPSEKPYTPEELKSSIVEEDMGYTTLMEEWNEYAIEDGAKIRIKHTVSRVSKTNKYNGDGEPIYLVEGDTLIKIKPPKRS